jgi:hypothetical protein
MRSVSGPFAAASVWIWTLVVTKALPQMYTSMGWGVYVFFASCLVCASAYAFFFIHDTKGLRVDEMDRLFGFHRSREYDLPATSGKGDDDSERFEKVGSVRIDHSERV